MQALIAFAFTAILSLIVLACGQPTGGFFALTTATSTSQILIIVSQDPSHAGITYYDLDGNFLGHITDFRSDGGIVRGIAPYDSSGFLVTLDLADSVQHVTFDGVKSTFHGSGLFNGNIYDIELASNDLYYAVDSTRIRAFNQDGTYNSTAYIASNVGGCTLSAPRALDTDANGYLVVADFAGSDVINRYDVSSITPSCVSSVVFGNDPYGILAHSNGSLYITTQADDQVYKADPDGSNATVVFSADGAVISNPTAIIEMPDGTLLVASSATHTIEHLQADGTRIGSTPFIRDVFSNNITDMMIMDLSE